MTVNVISPFVCSCLGAQELKMQGCALAVLVVDCHQGTEDGADVIWCDGSSSLYHNLSMLKLCMVLEFWPQSCPMFWTDLYACYRSRLMVKKESSSMAEGFPRTHLLVPKGFGSVPHGSVHCPEHRGSRTWPLKRCTETCSSRSVKMMHRICADDDHHHHHHKKKKKKKKKTKRKKEQGPGLKSVPKWGFSSPSFYSLFHRSHPPILGDDLHPSIEEAHKICKNFGCTWQSWWPQSRVRVNGIESS